MNFTRTYTLPRLCHFKYDLSKTWYIYFYFTDPDTGKKKNCRYQSGLNESDTKKGRELIASRMIRLYTNELESGWNPVKKELEPTTAEPVIEPTKVTQALDDILLIKKSYISAESYRTYYNAIGLFKKWMKHQKIESVLVDKFTPDHAQKFSDWLLKDKGYCGKTHNGYVGNIKTFFIDIVKRNDIGINPFSKISKVRQEEGKNVTYSKPEQKKIDEYLLKNDRDFYFATRFVRYCFLRRTELQKLQIKHINFDSKTITINSDSGKGRKQTSMTIPRTLEKIIVDMDILSLDPEMFIFGDRSFKPSYKPIARLGYFSDRQHDINIELEIRRECTFYSWKHTGVVELYHLTKDPYTVMRQCRHSDLRMTMIYLRSLGLGVNEDVRAW